MCLINLFVILKYQPQPRSRIIPQFKVKQNVSHAYKEIFNPKLISSCIDRRQLTFSVIQCLKGKALLINTRKLQMFSTQLTWSILCDNLTAREKWDGMIFINNFSMNLWPNNSNTHRLLLMYCQMWKSVLFSFLLYTQYPVSPQKLDNRFVLWYFCTKGVPQHSLLLSWSQVLNLWSELKFPISVT